MLEYLHNEGVAGWAWSMAVLVIAFGVTLLHFLMEPMRWQAAYLPTSKSGANSAEVRDVLFCTALATYLLPFKLGIPMRLGLLRHRAGLELPFIGAVLALDGIVSLCVWGGAAMLSAWFAALHWQSGRLAWVGLGCIVMAMAVALVMRKRLAGVITRRWHAITSLVGDLWRSAGISTLVLIADVGSYWLRHALLVFVTTGSLRLMVVGGAAGIVATFAGMVSGMPMGLVGYDATLVALLGTAGMRIEQAVAVAAINRGLTFLAAAVLGVPSGIRLGLGVDVASTLRKLREVGNGEE